MRLPAPIEVRRAGPNWRPVVAGLAVLGAVAAIGYVVTRGDGSSDAGTGAPADEPESSALGAVDAGPGVYRELASPVSVLDGAAVSASPTTIDLTDRVGLTGGELAVLQVVGEGGSPAELTVVSCGLADASPNVALTGSGTVRTVVTPIDASGELCASSDVDATVSIDVIGVLDQQSARPFARPVTVLDTTADGTTDDDRFATIGVRPESSTLRVPVAGRFAGLTDVGALLVSVAAVDPLADGDIRMFTPEAPLPSAALTEYEAGETVRATGLVPVGSSGALCVATTGSTDVVVEVSALVPSSVLAPVSAVAAPATPATSTTAAASPSPTSVASVDGTTPTSVGSAPSTAVPAIGPVTNEGEPRCAGEEFFPGRRVVAAYGTQRSGRLGVLGEQPPEEAAERLDEIAEPWRAGDRPVLPAFELIATLATGTPEERGTYNLRSEPEFVQEYLDVARRHGYYLILDLQPGQSDFLTEARYYEEFLREPDVGLALDPEWRTDPPDRPRGGFVGQVDAAEVNQVTEYLSRLVAEEDLPEKLLIVHQFQDRMITNKDQLVERPGVALTIHMDGFGPRAEKLNSYRIVKVPPPLNMGLKLFYDEDTDLLSADDVLNGGLFDPVPDLVTYQ